MQCDEQYLDECFAEYKRTMISQGLRSSSPGFSTQLPKKGRAPIVMVRDLVGKSLEYQFPPGPIYGKDVKEAILLDKGIPPEQQRLILGGRQLMDNTILEGCLNPETYLMLHLVLRLKGC